MQAFSDSQLSTNSYLFNNYVSLKIKADSLYRSDNYFINPSPDGNNNVFAQPKPITSLSNKVEPLLVQRNDMLNAIVVAELILSFVLVSLLIIRNLRYLKQYVQSLFYDFIADKTLGNISVPLKQTGRILDLLLVITISLLTYLSIKTLMPVTESVVLYSLVAAPVVVFFYRSWIWFLHKLLQTVIGEQNFIAALSFKNNLVLRLVGVFLLPVLFVGIYIRSDAQIFLVYMASIILLISLLYRYFLIVKMFIKQRVSILYFILYLCALELPVIFGLIYSFRMI